MTTVTAYQVAVEDDFTVGVVDGREAAEGHRDYYHGLQETGELGSEGRYFIIRWEEVDG